MRRIATACSNAGTRKPACRALCASGENATLLRRSPGARRAAGRPNHARWFSRPGEQPSWLRSRRSTAARVVQLLCKPIVRHDVESMRIGGFPAGIQALISRFVISNLRGSINAALWSIHSTHPRQESQ